MREGKISQLEGTWEIRGQMPHFTGLVAQNLSVSVISGRARPRAPSSAAPAGRTQTNSNKVAMTLLPALGGCFKDWLILSGSSPGPCMDFCVHAGLGKIDLLMLQQHTTPPALHTWGVCLYMLVNWNHVKNKTPSVPGCLTHQVSQPSLLHSLVFWAWEGLQETPAPLCIFGSFSGHLCACSFLLPFPSLSCVLDRTLGLAKCVQLSASRPHASSLGRPGFKSQLSSLGRSFTLHVLQFPHL